MAGRYRESGGTTGNHLHQDPESPHFPAICKVIFANSEKSAMEARHRKSRNPAKTSSPKNYLTLGDYHLLLTGRTRSAFTSCRRPYCLTNPNNQPFVTDA